MLTLFKEKDRCKNKCGETSRKIPTRWAVGHVKACFPSKGALFLDLRVYVYVHHIFNIRHKKRDDLKSYLVNHNIKTEIHYPVPPHQQKAMFGIFDNQHYPISEEIHNTTLSLPISYFHNQNDIEMIVDVMNKF